MLSLGISALRGWAPANDPVPEPPQHDDVATEADPFADDTDDAMTGDPSEDDAWGDDAPDRRIGRPSDTAEAAMPDPDDGPADDGSADDDIAAPLDTEALRAIVREVLREELQGALGERITRNVRKLVRAEIARAMTAQAAE